MMCTLNLLASAANISSYVKVDSAGIVGDNSINQPVITSQLPKYGVIALFFAGILYGLMRKLLNDL